MQIALSVHFSQYIIIIFSTITSLLVRQIVIEIRRVNFIMFDAYEACLLY